MCGDGHRHMNKAAHVTARKRNVPLNSLKEKLLTGVLVFAHLYPRTHHLPPAQWSALYSNGSTLGSVKETCQLIFRRCRSPWLNAADSALHGYRAGDTWEQIHKSMDKNETHCHNDWNQWMYPIHIKRAYSNLRCMDTWEWAATWHLHSSGTVESGRGSTIPYRAVTHRDEYWSFPN